MLMSGDDYRESLRRCTPRVFVNGDRVESVADDERLAARDRGGWVGVTYDFALDERYRHLMTAEYRATGTGRGS